MANGLVNYGIIKPELATSFARGFERSQAQDMERRAAEQELAGRQTMQQFNQEKLAQLRSERQQMLNLQERLAAAGQNPDLDAVFDVMIKSGVPDYVTKGLTGRQKLAEQRQFARIMGFDTGAPAAAAAPAAAPAAPANAFMGQAPAAAMEAPANALMGQAPAAAATPTPMAPRNAMAPMEPQTNEISNRINQLIALGTPQALQGAQILQSQLSAMKPPKETAALQEYNAAVAQGFKGTFFDFKRRLAEAGRAPAAPREPAAPTVTQIQDPTDPSRMITIDARRYQGGGMGSPGVIGTSGKSAPAAAAEQKKLEGQQIASDIIQTLRNSYDELDRMRAVPSDQRNAISNTLSYIASTGLGQVGGRMLGTKEQTERDIIQSSRNQILNAVKNATGMSAQQLNSNVEFRSWLESLTDPTRSYQSNTAVLDNLERFIASGGKYSAKPRSGAGAPAAAPPAAAPSAVPAPRAPAGGAANDPLGIRQ